MKINKMNFIPISQPSIGEKEIEYVAVLKVSVDNNFKIDLEK